MWPTNNDGSYPSYCANDPFNIANISTIVNTLNLVWYDIEYNGQNSSAFWTHEWCKHGTCCLSTPLISGEFNFFNQAIKYHTQYSIDKYFAAKGIVPSSSTGYSLSSLRAAISSGFGKEPWITCDSRDGKSLIHRVYLCLDPNLNPINCPSQGGYCNEPIYMLPIQFQ